MKTTCFEMDSGITEAECYERFGRRCKLEGNMWKLEHCCRRICEEGTRRIKPIAENRVCSGF